MTEDTLALFTETLRLEKLGLLWDAESSSRRFLTKWPEHFEALRLAARIAHRQGRAPEAAAFLARAARVMPSDVRTLDELARLLISLQQPADAIAFLQQGLSHDPRSIPMHHTLGIAFRDVERLVEAETAFRKAIELDSRYAPAHDGLIELMRRQGRWQEAQQCVVLALHHLPQSVSLRVALGDILSAQHEFPAAVQAYRQALDAGQPVGPILSRLGVALRELGDSNGSLDALRKAIAIDPQAYEPHYHLGATLVILGRFEDALDSLREAARLRPSATTNESLGAALVALGDVEGAIATLHARPASENVRRECIMRLGARLAGFGLRRQALDCFELVLNSDPSNSQAIHFVAALSGSNPDHPSPSYVLQLFEGFAPTFDDVLLGKIAYSGPREVKGAVLSASTLLPPWDILDLGCGTGLIGVELAAHAASLVGIDLSPRMIEIARKRDLYSRLICDDLFSALRDAPAASFDLVTAADVFVYVGKLDSLMPLIHRVMRAQGLFVFTAEAADGAPTIAPGADSVGYHLSNSGRYAHTAAYLSALAARNKFEVKAMNKFWLRVESDLPVAGWLAVWSTGSYER